jgi:hypothetical protein
VPDEEAARAYVASLTPAERDAAAVAALGDLSLRERRAPEEQAAHMLERALRRTKGATRAPISPDTGPQSQPCAGVPDGR